MISAVVLAAGMSRRMGKPKLLLKLGDHTVIEEVVNNVTNSQVCETIVVLGPHQQHFKDLLSNYNVKFVYNPRYAEGQGTSVSVGTAAVSLCSLGIIYLLGDQPLITTKLINNLLHHFINKQSLILRPAGSGNPTIFHTKLKRELMQLSGDVGGKQLIAKYVDQVTTIPGDYKFASLDIDTDADYQRILKLWQNIQNGKKEG